MLRKDTGKFSRPLGFAYIIFQVVGAFLAGFIAFIFVHDAVDFGIEDTTDIWPAIASEGLGSFFLAFLYLTQTEEKTKLSHDPAITTMIIAASYLAALLMVSAPENYLACLNPAVAFGACFEQIYAGNLDGWKRFYVYLPVPFAGALGAVFFHEFIYKKVSETI
jgi:glycerol uptake facilitator-like aquaporin